MLVVEESTISHAWGKALLHVLDRPGKELTPLILSTDGFEKNKPVEDPAIRQVLDDTLAKLDYSTVHTVANTIFPSSIWQFANRNRERLFNTYLDALPRIKASDRLRNRHGLYFERLIGYGRGPQKGNQLEHILQCHRKGLRRSLYQASIFDPGEDHVTAPRVIFPCLQHVSFVPNFQKNSLGMNAFYATQQLLEKAYGNYLGLGLLGCFMAQEMGLRLQRLTCYVGIGKLSGEVAKTSPKLRSLVTVLRERI